MEKELIIQTVISLFSGADERNWVKVRNAIADTVLIDYTSLAGSSPSTQTSKQVADAWAAFLPGFDSTCHHLSNFTVKQNGYHAIVYYTGKADHFIGNQTWTVEGTYETELIEKDSHWKIVKHKFNLVKQSGNTGLPAKAVEIINNRKINTLKEKIHFNSEGLVLTGNLYKPQNFDPSKKYPAIVVGGSWTTVKEQMSGLYAEELAKKDFITLAFDPRYFGESEGQPRFWENPAAKFADFKNAITYLESVAAVDSNNIFLTGVCASAGYMATVAAKDKRVKGLATIAAWLHDGEAVKLIYGGEEGVQAKIKEAQEARKLFAETAEIAYIPAISKTDTKAAMFGDFDYYLNPNRGAVPQWSATKFAVMSWEDWLTFNPMPIAKKIRVPMLMVHSDGAVLADYAKLFFKDIPHDNKVLHWTEGTQFDFYDQPVQVAEAVAVINTFFKQHIS